MNERTGTATEDPADVVRGLYEALAKGDVPGVLARLDPEVVVDEPGQLPYGGVHRGREAFAESVLGAMTGYAEVAVTGAEVFAGPTGVVGRLTGALTARSTGEVFPLTMLEVHQVEGGTVRRIDVHLKNPHELAAFYARAEAGRS
ncbi:nuclear transport factor 2 family protein [Streptomyces cocklensis]|jgi:ketosteroid isomerase-like protein|uniref:SnoaL-like domain-containing protein n=1 Tax=Actinacidiphila cocklensis TaxID=887465 RepID=A0A9W4GR55_9ACTN|nr:nuclear transport factor 2 family protein [Actinacidiphila cocklensis]MDD1061552.1 nuclear transport factor 2 family protein [Actinacidiphila cocklensis]WSX77614.1 nuclear transport factor 2 family protein [Streptomyces sp. NBC_00899]CAG6392276.1 SnoaL-like domain-containing protein [Actinacidiphila cocklensis]